MRRLTITIDGDLEQALAEAPDRLDLDPNASESERLRAYARRGYEAALEDELERYRLETYRRWADEPELAGAARAASRRAAERGVYRDG